MALSPQDASTSRSNFVPLVDNTANPFADGHSPTTTAAPVTAAVTNEPEKHPEPNTIAPKPPFYKRRGFIIANVIGSCVGIAFLFIMLFPVVRAIIQDIVNQTTLDITSAIISNPTNSSFQMSIQGTVYHTSSIPAAIKFQKPINVSWIDSPATKVPLGYMQLSPLHASHGQATINDTTTFYITNQSAFDRFASFVTTSPNFTWQLESHLAVQAEKFPVAHDVSFNKMITLNGVNNFDGNVSFEELRLPSGNIINGLIFASVLQLGNPSSFAVNVGTVVVDLFYKGVYLGNGTSFNTQMSLGNNTVTATGVFVPQTTLSNIAVVTQLVTNYATRQTSIIIATGNSSVQPDGTTVSWLSESIQSLVLTMPFEPTTPINPLGLFNISNLSLPYTT